MNWIVTGLVGIGTSIIGAAVYAAWQRYSAGRSRKRRHERIHSLEKEKAWMMRVAENPTHFHIHFLGILYFIMLLSALATIAGYGRKIGIEMIEVFQVGLYVGVVMVAYRGLVDIVRFRDISAELGKIDEAILNLKKQSEPGATDNPDDAQRLREDH